MTNDIILKCESVVKLYRQGENSIYALLDVNLEVKRGQFVMICGKSGSGKSTLLNMLSGFDTPTSGRVFIDGVDINDASEKERCRIRNEKIGFVFQNYNLLPILTAFENIIAPMQIGKRQWSEAYFRQICDRLGMLVMVENRHFSVSSDTLEQVEALVKTAGKLPLFSLGMLSVFT